MASTTLAAADFAHQTLTIDSPSGTVQFTMDDLSYYLVYAVRISINYGTQLGASVILLIALVLLTHADKRSSVVFMLNTVSLLLNIIRVTLGCLYYTGPFYQPYLYFSTDYSGVSMAARATSVAANVMTLLVLICVEASLVFQVRVVSAVSRSLERFCLMAFSICIAVVAVSLRLTLVVLASAATINLENTVDLAWLSSATNITMTISICCFCLIFLVKLGFALKQRRKLGIKQFGPMQVIFIMGAQTLFVPAIFSIFQYVGEPVALQSLVLTSVILFLPLSAMWAAAQVDKRTKYTTPAYGKLPSQKMMLNSGTTESTTTDLKSEPSRNSCRCEGLAQKASPHGIELV